MKEMNDGLSDKLAIAALAGTGVPAHLQPGLWKAVTRLITGGGGFRSPGLEGRAHQATGADAGILPRAMNTLMSEAVGKQTNRERIARLVTQELATPEGADPRPSPLNPAEPAEDWMNAFVQHAELKSSNGMQSLWAKVLAGEVRRPGSFSLIAMGHLAQLDQTIISDFEALGRRLVGSTAFTVGGSWSGAEHSALFSRLANAGLVDGSVSGSQRQWPIGDEGHAVIDGRRRGLVAWGLPGQAVRLPAFWLTRTGLELIQLMAPADEDELFMDVLPYIPKQDLAKIQIGNINDGRVDDRVDIWVAQ